MSIEAIRAGLADAKRKAGFFTTKRRKDTDLYRLLAECLALCEQAERDNLTEALRASIAEKPAVGRNRVYAERGSDIYLIVGRYVFEPEVNPAAAWRYSATMREAAKRQISSASLAGWLASQGGINALFRARPVAARTARTKTLHLNDAVEVPKDAPFTITLRRDGRGFFDVVPA